jgi:hypothetical protein
MELIIGMEVAAAVIRIDYQSVRRNHLKRQELSYRRLLHRYTYPAVEDIAFVIQNLQPFA